MSESEKQLFLRKLSMDAQSLVVQGKKEEALKCYDKILEKYPEESFAIYGKGMVHYEYREYPEAIAYFDQILAKNENEVDSLYAKGSTLNSLGKQDEALEIFNKVIKLEPKMDLAWMAKGYVLLDFDKAADALKCFEKVDELGRGLDVSSGKGHAFRMMDQLSKAKEWYTKAHKENPYDSEALFGLGFVEYKKDNLKQAQDFLYRCVVQDDENLEAWEILAEIFKATKQSEREKIALDKVVELKSKD